VNIITRKDFDGMAFTLGYTKPENEGGEREELSALLGINGDKGRIVMGAGRTSRGMVYTRDRPWGQTLGVSSFGNNIVTGGLRSIGNLYGQPSLGCTDPDFWMAANGTCSFNFNSRAADEAEITQTSIFARGEYRFSKDWTTYMNASLTNTTSFGRYAPTPAQLTVQPTGPNTSTTAIPNSNNPTAAPIVVRHRTAAAGNRDTNTDNNLTDFLVGVQGKVFGIDVDLGARNTLSKYDEKGRNYIVRPILEQYVNQNIYNLFAPNANDPAVLSAIKATIGRDSKYKVTEGYGTATFYNLFKTGGGSATLLLGAEVRKETYADIYDSLSEAGVIEGSAGNSAAGTRNVKSATAELLIPLTKQLEVTVAGRFEDYSDYGNDFAPKVSMRFQPMRTLTLRASYGEGFRAPSLPILNQKETFSAESVFDPVTCRYFGGSGTILTPRTPGLRPADDCDVGKLVQVDTYTGSNPSLKSETSKQFAFGAVWDATEYLSLKADYYNIKIDNTISLIGAQDLIDRSNGSDPRPIPAGLYVRRGTAGEILRVQQGYANEGTLKAAGLDLSVEARWKLANAGSFRHELRYSHVLTYDQDGSDLVGALGLPEFRTTLNNGWTMGPFAAAWNINVIGKNGTAAGRTASQYVTHDLQFSWNTPVKGSKLTLGVVNATGKMPELVAYDGRNFNFYLYDGYGRQPYIRYEQKL